MSGAAMNPLSNGFGYMAAGLIAAGNGMFDIPAIVQAGALGVVLAMVSLGYKRDRHESISRAKESEDERKFRGEQARAEREHREKMHEKSLEAIQRAYTAGRKESGE